MRWLSTPIVALCLTYGSFEASCSSKVRADDALPKADAQVDYLRDVKPLLEKRCYACHGAIQQKSGLRLDTVAAILKGGASGEIVVAGKPEESYLLEVLSEAGGVRMPPEGEGTLMSAEEVSLVRRWIAQGAIGPKDEQPQQDPREYWSYKLPTRASLPELKDPAWVLNPIDAWIAADHERHGLFPRPDAEPAVLLRRLYLDLIGLPPTREELHRFLADPSEEAYQREIEALLARPEYGERWGRHWMDVWRYSDWYGSRGGNEIRYSQRHIWRWRDWIVESLNADKGYDQMIVEMLAGDELAPNDPDTLRATGFLGRNWYKFDRNVWMFETVEQTSQAFLGLTLKCCRCHDHKFDPIEQKEYYQFRAFFEPHDVRTDPISGSGETERDATLGPVLKVGLARVYDKQIDVPTYLFRRGDDRHPVESEPLSPGVPAALSHKKLEIETVKLAPESYYPSLRPEVIQNQIDTMTASVKAAADEIIAAEQKVANAREKLAAVKQAVVDGVTPASPVVFLHEKFAKAEADVWKPLSGQWVYEGEHLVQKQVTSFATMVSLANHPRDFRAKLRYRTLAPGAIRSVGFSFDYLDNGNSQDVYTSTGDAKQTVQAFHRDQGKQSYPAAGIVPVTLKVGEETTVEVAVRGSNLKIWLNGELKLDYAMPIPRRDGRFALWVHDGSAEFLELHIESFRETPEEMERLVQARLNDVALAEAKQTTMLAEQAALLARIAAERAKYMSPPDPHTAELAAAASKAERHIQVTIAARELMEVEQTLATLPPSDAVQTAVKPEAEPLQIRRMEAEKKLTAARESEEKADGTYAPLGPMFPTESTGRRLALARWIADKQNPRTARVAVNQIWMRHFGEPLVSTVANFGMNGTKPTHPELLDWLSVEFMENGWSMKHLHRLLVSSHTYRLVSSDGDEKANGKIDPNNHLLWRMNSRRMEAEVVRDSVLAITGGLDRARGGPEIPESQGQTVYRRSMYFRNTPNEKMPFLELFDVANPNACYRRVESVVPNQALAMSNSALTLNQSRLLAGQLTEEVGAVDDETTNLNFITAAFEQILNRPPTAAEKTTCQRFLTKHAKLVAESGKNLFPANGQGVRAASATATQRARENLVHVLFSHNDFVTIR